VKTIHVVLNAHIDPVWLWPWQAGLDAMLNTWRTVCDLLESNPEIVFTQSDAWFYRQTEKVDPALFDRVLEHVRTGQWHPTGGWWIQPDCNLPSAEGLEKQIELGRDYFESRFGSFPRVGFNVDTFGHPASLPSLMRRNEQDRYVMMRPQEHEMALPARLFRWRRAPAEPEVVAFRVAGAYATFDKGLEEHVRMSLTELPPGVDHTMCFMGVGDHGGGPTRRLIEWIDAHRELDNGWRLEYSTPEAFFEAVAVAGVSLPTVEGELQHHAVGCYSVDREIKLGLRRAENTLLRAAAVTTEGSVEEEARLASAWRDVCFAAFHDIIAGTCIPSSYEQVSNRLGRASSEGDELSQITFRRLVTTLDPEPVERFVLYNPGPRNFAGYVTLERSQLEERVVWDIRKVLVDDSGTKRPYQTVQPEAAVEKSLMSALLVHVVIPAGGLEVLRIRAPRQITGKAPSTHAWIDAEGLEIRNEGGTRVRLEEGAPMNLGDVRLPIPRLVLIADPSDTWSHGVTRYDGSILATPRWANPMRTESGPLRASLFQEGELNGMRVTREARLYAAESFVEWCFEVEWTARGNLLKLLVEPEREIATRIDGIPGGDLERPPNGLERPVRDWTMLLLDDGTRIGVVCPEVFALDSDRARLRLTLLRSPIRAHHDPLPAASCPKAARADRGAHRFVVRIDAGKRITPERLDLMAWGMQNPPMIAATTAGMELSGNS